jgi:hypothetical protein
MKGDWKNRRNRLLKTPINRLGLKISSPPLSRCINNLYRELTSMGIRFHPPCYLSNGWGCPDLVPIIGIPFYLSSSDLSRLHREMGYDVENRTTITRLLRHEAGHAINYAYRLYKREDWEKVFGPINKAYSDQYIPNPFSTQHVIHAKHFYAQKHPDEDFAEVFAVWLAPGSDWEKIYGGTPVMRKLLYVRDIISRISQKRPFVRSGEKDVPVEEMRFTLLEYYGATPEQYRAETRAYIEEVLRKIFVPDSSRGRGMPAAGFMRMYREELIARIAFWSGVDRGTVTRIFNNFVKGAEKLGLRAPHRACTTLLIDITSLITFYVHTYIHTRKVFTH